MNKRDGIAFRQEKRVFSLVVKQEPQSKLGFIDLERKKGCLYEISKHYPDALFTDFLYFALFLFLNNSRGFLIHACGISKENKGYIFTGPSRSGKSTVARLSKGLTILSDDHLCVKKRGDSYYMYGVPWGRATTNRFVEVKKIFSLKKAEQTSFKKLGLSLAAAEIFYNLPIGLREPEIIEKPLTVISKMVAKIPCYEMRFSLLEPFWDRIDSLED